MKSDFFDLKDILENNLDNLLKKIPHQIINNEKKVISQFNQTDIVNEKECDLSLLKTNFGKLRCKDESKDYLQSFINQELVNISELRKQVYKSKKSEMLLKDIASLYHLAQTEDLTEVALKLLQYIQSHILIKSCSIFKVSATNSLLGFVGIHDGKIIRDKENWSLPTSTIAGIAATTKKYYLCNSPTTDKNFRLYEHHETPKNVISYPLVMEEKTIGVFNITNKQTGDITEEDISIISTFASAAAYIMEHYRSKETIKVYEKTEEKLQKFVAGDIVRDIKQKKSVNPGGTKRHCVMLFSDIRSFTAISEGLDPETLVSLLNYYFEQMYKVIEKYHGTLDKIVGDLLMVVWNMTHDQPDAELLAVRCALEMQKVANQTVKDIWAHKGVNNFSCGIGINAGEVIAGELGSSKFVNYTVIGDAVNSAERLESRAKPGEVWVADHVVAKIKHQLPMQPIRVERNLQLKGKGDTVTAFVFSPIT